jgi:hypothetical protein
MQLFGINRLARRELRDFCAGDSGIRYVLHESRGARSD